MAIKESRWGRPPRPNPIAVGRARALRRNETEAERKLWRALRSRQVEGGKFRRQVPIGPYVVDFACIADHLVIELDGSQHAEKSAADAARTRILTAHGYKVLRFWNNDVMNNLEGVIKTIRLALGR